MSQSTGVNYKSTLNLPRTDFPMRAALNENEPRTLKRWRAAGLYRAVQEARAADPHYNFHDGPPYANGLIHAGHLLNKVLKDLVVRSRTMSGRRCPYFPGWDCHGLPIEHKVVSDMLAKGKAAKLESLGDDQRRLVIRRECRAAAEKFHGLQSAQFERLLTLSDYDHPYLTMTPDYEQGVLEVFADMLERGLVYRALKSVHWSIENRTALAEAELEYENRTDTAVYVDFEADDRDAVAAAFGVELDERPSLMIWTTTPWTLPANLAIAVNPAFRYALVRIDGSITVIAADLVQRVAAAGSAVESLGETAGSRLVGLRYRHPFCDRVSPVVAAGYVTLEDGTGLVHTAPGHGAEDNQTALREGLDIYCPVLADGTYDDTVPPWLAGRSIWKANAEIVEHLRGSGHLFHSHQVTHSYPHDWRSKTPVIFRATEQWFVGVDTPIARGPGAGSTLRQLALGAIGTEMAFYPSWGRNRMRGMLESRPDWCISRQRSWGLPIPAFTGPGGTILLTPASVRAVAGVFGSLGSDAWFTEKPETLLAGWDPAGDPDAPEELRGASPGQFAKTHDIFDVWFESGSSWHAAMRRNRRGFPTDLYLEGSDQHRGWFQLSLVAALGATGQAPFRALLTHGFIVDRDGRKMSKSVGNTLDVEDVLKDFGAEVCRWWVSSLAYENDIKMDVKFLEAAGESYRKVRNTLRFLLGNLADFDAGARAGAEPDAASIDAWALGELAAVHAAALEAYDQYSFRQVHGLVYDFCNETLSAVYCAAVKDRLYCDRADSPRRRATQAVMHAIADRLCRLLAPILPHTAEEAFFAMEPASSSSGSGRSVHLETWQAPPATARDPAWAAAMSIRPAALRAVEAAKARGIENPLDAGVTLPDPDGALAPVAPELADLLGVSRVALVDRAGEPEVLDLREEPRCDRCWRRCEGTARRSDGGTLCDRCAEAVGV